MHFWKYHNADIHGTFKTPTQMKATSNRGELQHQHGEQLEFTFLEGRPDALGHQWTPVLFPAMQEFRY